MKFLMYLVRSAAHFPGDTPISCVVVHEMVFGWVNYYLMEKALVISGHARTLLQHWIELQLNMDF